MTEIRLGISLWPEAATWDELLDASGRVERLGYESLWTCDHLYPILGDLDQPIHEGCSVLAAWAMATKTVRLGLLVGANTFRNPALFAKAAVTIDHISRGRAILGIGAGWFKPEHEAYGIDFGAGVGQRLDWLDEAAKAIRALVDGGEVTSAPGGRYRFERLRLLPGPLQSRLPILIGGSGEHKTLRTVALYADQWNTSGTPETLAHKNSILRQRCLEVGRDEREIARTVGCMIVIRDTNAEAKRAWSRLMAYNRQPRARWHGPEFAWVGTPLEIAVEIRSRMKVGFDLVLVQMPAPYDVETIERLIGEVKPIVDGMA